MTKTLIVGASGTVGSEVARLLAAQGHAIRRASSRVPTASDQVRLDLRHPQAQLAAAFDGVDRLFLLAPPGHVNQNVLLAPLIEQAKARGLKKVVLMSAMGADADDAAPLRQAELHLARSGVAWNVIRPNWFMQNFNTFWLQGIREHGRVFLPVGRAKGSFIDARDIAAVAARLLHSHDLDNQAFDLTGAEALDHDEVAAILSREAGRTIMFEDITPEAMRTALADAHLPPAYADFLVLILGFFKAGYSERVTDAVQRITGQAPRSFEAYAADYRAAWV